MHWVGQGRRTNCSRCTGRASRYAWRGSPQRWHLPDRPGYTWYSQCSSARQLPRACGPAPLPVRRRRQAAGRCSARRRFLTSPLRHPARSGLFSHPVRRLLPHRGDTQEHSHCPHWLCGNSSSIFSTTGSCRTAKRREAYPSIKPKISPNRLMAITAIQTALITTSPNH